jgi:hypothetical protein
MYNSRMGVRVDFQKHTRAPNRFYGRASELVIREIIRCPVFVRDMCAHICTFAADPGPCYEHTLITNPVMRILIMLWQLSHRPKNTDALSD